MKFPNPATEYAYRILYGDGPDSWMCWCAPGLSINNYLSIADTDEYDLDGLIEDLRGEMSTRAEWTTERDNSCWWETVARELLDAHAEYHSDDIGDAYAAALAEEAYRNLPAEERLRRETDAKYRLGLAVDLIAAEIPAIWQTDNPLWKRWAKETP